MKTNYKVWNFEIMDIEDQIELAKQAVQKALGHLSRAEQVLKLIKEGNKKS